MALKQETNKQSQDLHYQLKIAGEMFSKAWHLIPAYKLMVILAGVVAMIALVAFATLTWNIEISFGAIFFLVLLTIIALSVPLLHWLMPASKFRFIFKTGATLLGYIVAKIHLDYVNGKFLDRGRLERLLKL